MRSLGMTRYALRGLGLGAEQAGTTVQVMRLLPADWPGAPPRPQPVG